jgi:Arc/MetJ-type ribon-helix-helix transcriptional regulator
MSNASNDKVNIRLTGEDLRWLRMIQADMRKRRGILFVNPAEVVRAALRMAAEKAVMEGAAEQVVMEGMAQNRRVAH